MPAEHFGSDEPRQLTRKWNGTFWGRLSSKREAAQTAAQVRLGGAEAAISRVKRLLPLSSSGGGEPALYGGGGRGVWSEANSDEMARGVHFAPSQISMATARDAADGKSAHPSFELFLQPGTVSTQENQGRSTAGRPSASRRTPFSSSVG